MSAFPTVNFGQSENGQFSPEEIRRLMEIEVARSQRYDYPLSLLLAEVDRLESLHDLYGVDSKQRIVRSVLSLLRSSTRSSDVLGSARGERLLVLFPHTSRAAISVVARRLLSGCRELEFRGDGRVLRATLSIGLSQRAAGVDLDGLIECAERALEAALEAGGDRAVEFENLPRRGLPPPRAGAPLVGGVAGATGAPGPPTPAALPARAAPRPAASPLPDPSELAGSTLEEKVADLFGRLGPGAPAADDVLSTIHGALAEVRGRRATHAEVEREIQVLEGRVARLKELLGASEEELARMVQEKSLDPGIASIYRTVQGIDPSASNYRKKKELLAVIYKANVELLRQLRESNA